jgi:hypothetical protein
MGGPDLLPYKKGQMNNSYGFIKECDGTVPTGVAVQSDDYDYINPQTGKKVTMSDIFNFGKDYLKLDYIFREFREPEYSNELLPFLKDLKN